MSLSHITLCKISRVLLLSAGFLVTVPSAWAQAKGDDRQWYLTLNGGWLGMRDASASLEPPSAPSRSGDLKLGGGTQFGGTLGYRINSSWRVEGEITYRSSSIDSTTVAGLTPARVMLTWPHWQSCLMGYTIFRAGKRLSPTFGLMLARV